MVKSGPSVSSSPSQLYTRKDVVVSCVLLGHSVTLLNRGRVDWPLRFASPSLAPLAVLLLLCCSCCVALAVLLLLCCSCCIQLAYYLGWTLDGRIFSSHFFLCSLGRISMASTFVQRLTFSCWHTRYALLHRARQ